ncbi:VWA domain-containing protein [Streptomyces sp. WAC04114]|uniref:VWA domain-containing protein n=1 Tax=Streptomyces sp. WAC04114 TaxID=2867961 RepID=UPI001C8B415B|nr:VWA domain-containing protein [Streptomyces sp. WAC04114]MBX9363503.1 VWA domain-containing protein [Streptomyces sp. WAC04114]
MGILTRLRNAFGRPRKSQTAEPEGAAQTTPAEPTISETTPTAPAATPKVPSPSPEPAPGPTATVPEPRDDEHDLVSAAFDKVAGPRPADSTESAPTPAAEAPRAEETPDAAAQPTTAETPSVTDKATKSTSAAEKPTEAEPERPAAAEEPTEAETEPPTAAEKPTETEPETPAAAAAAVAAEEPTAAEAEAPAVAEKPAAAKPETPAAAEKPTPADEATAEKPAPVEEPSEEDKPTPAAEPAPADEATAPTDTKAETEPEPDAAPEAAAADGDPAPQGPPAADDENSTGGADGNKTAEGEAEATNPTADTKPKRKTTPKTESKTESKANAKAKPATEPKSDTDGPALPLTRVKTRAPGLTTAYKAAATTLDSHNLTGTRAKVYLVLDRSASMRPYYKDGSAQALAEQTLALAAHLDPEATVPVVFFSTELDGTGEITLTDHENKIDELHAGLGRMGRTSYHAAVEAVLAHHDKTAADPTTPALVVFQTDGAPDAKTPATQALTDAAKTHPTVFFSFVAFGDPANKAFDYLRKLKTPNTSHFLAGETPRELTDKELYEGVLANWRP